MGGLNPYRLTRAWEDEAVSLEAHDKSRALELWAQYAKFKLSKGSYLLAVYGSLQVARLLEASGDELGSAEQYLEAARVARDKLKDHALATLLLLNAARAYMLAEKWLEAAHCYEEVGALWEGLGNYFMAADAYEHAANSWSRAGLNARGYVKPLVMWLKNAGLHLSRGSIDDARWSLQRALEYLRSMA